MRYGPRCDPGPLSPSTGTGTGTPRVSENSLFFRSLSHVTLSTMFPTISSFLLPVNWTEYPPPSPSEGSPPLQSLFRTSYSFMSVRSRLSSTWSYFSPPGQSQTTPLFPSTPIPSSVLGLTPLDSQLLQSK